MINDIFNIMLPQIALIICIFVLLLMGMLLSPRNYRYSRLISIVGIFISILLLTTVQVEPIYFGFRNTLISDSYTLLFDFVILFCGFLVAILSKKLISKIKRNAYTYHAILISSVLGALNIVSANDFLTLFVSMELMGFSTYFLISASKGYYSKEAAFKYLITSAVSSGVFLLGVSYLYGITGSINLSHIYIFTENQTSLMYSVSSILVILGLISKLAVFPFANWVIDVYKGCETSVLAFLSTIPKLALFGIVCRLFVFPLRYSLELVFVVLILCVITAIWANTYALRENNVKVIFACSSAANASFALLTASIVSVYNISAVIFYIIVFAIMDIGVFAFLNIWETTSKMELNYFKGFFYKNHLIAGMYSILVLGLAGIPITSGFVAKIYLFSAIAQSGWLFIVFLIALLVLSVMALFYYIKLISPLFENCDGNANVYKLEAIFSQKFVLIMAAIITIMLGLFPEKIIELCWFITYNM